MRVCAVYGELGIYPIIQLSNFDPDHFRRLVAASLPCPIAFARAMLVLLSVCPALLTGAGRAAVAPVRRVVQPRLAESSSPLSEEAIKSKLASIKRKKRPLGTGSAPAPAPPPAAPPPEAATPAAAAPAPEAEAVNDGPPPMERLQAVVASRTEFSAPLDAPTAAAIVSFLNEELGDAMIGWVLAHTELGKQAGGKNIWSRPP